MINKEMLQSKIFMLFLVFLVGFFVLLGNSNVQALETTEVELDFSKVDNSWGLTEKMNFTVPASTKGELFHISVNKKTSELIVWYYNENLTIDGTSLTSNKQNIYLQIFKYNTSTQSFKYDHDWTYSNVNKVDKFDIIYSSYEMVEKTEFPVLTYQYNLIKKMFENNPTYKHNLEYFITKLKNEDFTFILTIGLDGRVRPFISLYNKEFFYNYTLKKLNAPVWQGNNSSSVLGYIDNYTLNDLTEEFVNGYVEAIKKKFKDFNTTGCYENCSSGNGAYDAGNLNDYNKTIVLYSSFGSTFKYEYYPTPVFINEIPYLLGNVPTLNELYKVLDVETKIIINDKMVDITDLPNLDIPDEDINNIPIIDDTSSSTDIMKVIKTWMSNIFNSFPIYKQLQEVKKAMEYHGQQKCWIYDGDTHHRYDVCMPDFKIKFDLFGLNIESNALDLTWYWQYRDTVFFYVRLVVYSTTVYGSYKMLSKFFNN